MAACFAYSSWIDHIHVSFLHKIWPQLFSQWFVDWSTGIHPIWHFTVLFAGSAFLLLFFLGIVEFRRIKRIKTAISDLGFNSKSGARPKLMKIESLGDGKSKLTVASGGFGIDRFQSRKSDLSAAFGQVVEEIQVSPGSVSNYEIYLCEKELPMTFNFSDHKHLLTKPYSFIVGQSYKGVITQNLRTLPHMFICGTTGGGKSVFVNNVILGLMNSSSRIRFCLIDLKKGIEVQDYKDFPKVEIAKNEREAVNMLSNLNRIMDERFKYLEENKRREIDPELDKMDIIVVSIDEVSEAFDTTTKDSDLKEQRQKIYELAHRLSKLSRAAGFHMIFSTQKIKKTLLPTEIQTNIGGRMSFKLPTASDSVTAIGNKKAYELPDVKGRGIWHQGNTYTQVQGPYLSNNDIKEELVLLKPKFEKSPEGEKKENNFSAASHTTKSVDAFTSAKNSEVDAI